MVGLVIVSHSRALAEALKEFLAEAGREALPVAVAAGAGPAGEVFGTNPHEIARAITAVSGPDGVLVLADIGSAVLSAEMALELLPDAVRAGVLVSSAPLVEGAFAAAVQMATRRSLAEVRAEAERSLAPKIRHLGAESLPAGPEAAGPSSGFASTAAATLHIENEHGLHARPAAKFARTAARFAATVLVQKHGVERPGADGTSLNALMMLGIRTGDAVDIRCQGTEAGLALDALRDLVQQRFGEDPADIGEEGPPPDRREAERVLGSAPQAVVSLSAGIAIGPLVRQETSWALFEEPPAGDPAGEWERFRTTLEAVRQRMRQIRDGLQGRVPERQLEVFDACAMTLDDPMLLGRVRGRVFDGCTTAAAAWRDAVGELLTSYRTQSDSYLRQRASDIEEIGRQVLAVHLGAAAGRVPPRPDGGILVVDELAPGLVGGLDPRRVAGLAAVHGGPSSHGAILARALGIPAVAGIGSEVPSLAPGTRLALDGIEGRFWVDPPDEVLRELTRRRQELERSRVRVRRRASRPAVTRDGTRVHVEANLGSAAEAVAARERGAEGVGVLRTEFLYLFRNDPPSEEAQAEALGRIARTFAGLPVRVRTLDIGGDKTVPYLRLPRESNPFLGVRSIRHSLRNPEVFVPQLRAILRAADQGNVQILFPLIATLDDLEQALAHLERAHASLREQGVPHRWPIPVGAMIETPSAALLAERLARSVDFLSIGTNDLVQYTLAAERGNAELEPYADGLHPAVLQLIARTVRAGRRAGRSVAVCGELAGDAAAIPILLGLGVDCLSASPERIPEIKERVRGLDIPAAGPLARRALKLRSAAEVRDRVGELAAPAQPGVSPRQLRAPARRAGTRRARTRRG
jgi:phosphoenolpyruvate-protein phosphotransferase/dihydroxyacetone kinase phosphotransfer subunit